MSKLSISAFLLLFFTNYSIGLGAEKLELHCTGEDREYANSWNNYYDPEDAFDFGETIKNLVKEENLDGLFELVDGELDSGPRKEFIRGKQFSEIFSKEWVDSLLNSVSPCAPMGWRGFMLDSGSVWYNRDKEKDKWHIFGILGAKKEDLTNKNIPVGLEFEGRVIPLIVSQLPGCLGIITKISQINLRLKIMSTFLKILVSTLITKFQIMNQLWRLGVLKYI